MAGAVVVLTEDEKALLKKLKEAFDNHNRIARGGLVNCGLITDEGKVYIFTNTACHAELSYPGAYTAGKQLPINGPKARFIISKDMTSSYMAKQKQVPIETKHAFLKWLTTSSPYRKCFVKKGGKAVDDYGYVVVTPIGVPANLMAGALIAHRMLWEYYGTIPVIWHELVKNGVHPSIAFFHAHQVKTGDKENIDSINWNLNGHNCLAGNAFDKSTVLNFKNGVHVNPLPEWQTEKNQYRYSPVTGLWGVGDGSYLTSILPDIKKAAISTVVREKKVNPFPKPGENPNLKEMVPIGTFCKLWAEKLIEAYKDA